MDFDLIENLVTKAKYGDKFATEEIINSFKPFIVNLSKKTFIAGYDKSDIQNECYKLLLKSLKKYDTSKKRFVAYGTISIKNGLKDLIRKNVKYTSKDDYLKDVSFEEEMDSLNNQDFIDPISRFDDIECIKKALNSLETSEKELINCLYFKNLSLKQYSLLNNMNYYKCLRKKKAILNKLSKKYLN